MSELPKKVWIHGLSGRMGEKIHKELSTKPSTFSFLGGSSLQQDDFSLAENADIILDFSSSQGNEALFAAVQKMKARSFFLLICSTGLPTARLDQWRTLTREKGLTTLIAPNTSLGVLILSKVTALVAPIAARHGFDMALVETHHRRKLDAPSGTANFLAAGMARAVPELAVTSEASTPLKPMQLTMHSIRGGGVFGEHELRLISETEELTLGHRALSRDLFASGALVMAEWLLNQKSGFYGLDQIALEDLPY